MWGPEVYNLYQGKITSYKVNGSNGSSTILYWYYNQNSDKGYFDDDAIYTTHPVKVNRKLLSQD